MSDGQFWKKDPWEGARPPKRYLEFDLMSGTATQVSDLRDTQDIPDRPVYLWCDFCLQPKDRLWCYPVKPFRVELGDGSFIEQPADSGYCWWCACVFCQPLFQARDWPVLAARHRTLAGRHKQKAPDVIKLWDVVANNLTGDPTVWNSGELRISKR